ALGAARCAGPGGSRLGLARARKDVTLHAADLTITRATATAAGVEVTARPSPLKADEAVTLRFAKPLPKGEVRVDLVFEGKLNTHLRGLYAASANGKPYAFTQ